MTGRRRLTAVIAALAVVLAAALVASPADAAGRPEAVVAVIDTGINPYHVAFRDRSSRAFDHPSTYIPGYPPQTPALRLTLDAPSYEAAVRADQKVWGRVRPKTLYWVPGTRLVGVYTLTGKILDTVGLGTMAATRVAGGRVPPYRAAHSLAPDARLMVFVGASPANVRRAADTRWVDVQTSSWESRLAGAATSDIRDAFEYASRKQLVLTAAGNGVSAAPGPLPNHLRASGGVGTLVVGAHDNGRAVTWSDAPPHLVADGYGGYRAQHKQMRSYGPHPTTCCTHAAAPYAAGGAAAIILEARRLVGQTTTGIRNGVVARGNRRMKTGPLSDGVFTLEELRAVLLRTAQARPVERPDDGLVHWLAGSGRPEYTQWVGPGANPWCLGCVSLPVSWTGVPEEAPLLPLVGYGAVNDLSVRLAKAVLRGEARLPARDMEDAFFMADGAARDAMSLPRASAPQGFRELMKAAAG